MNPEPSPASVPVSDGSESARSVGLTGTTTYRHPRLNELALLEADWDSYGAPPLSEAALTAADRLVFIPTGDGGVQIELHSGGRELEVTINESGVIEAVWVLGGVRVER